MWHLTVILYHHKNKHAPRPYGGHLGGGGGGVVGFILITCTCMENRKLHSIASPTRNSIGYQLSPDDQHKVKEDNSYVASN